MAGTIEKDERLMGLFAMAKQKPPSERDAFLRAHCGGDAELFREVAEMVKEEENMGSFLLHPMIAFQALPRPFQPGENIAERFEIIREIGEGGMGVVYEAFDRKRGLRIAIKAAKPGFQRLLSPELEGALTVRHPNVCRVNEIYTTQTDAGEIDFLTMELLEGETLSGYLKARGKLSEIEALTIARQLCAGLSEAHRSGVIHRDLKSANIILCNPSSSGRRVVITDFGLSGAASGSDDLAGTPQYMAPELWRGERTSKASDIYALGVVLYEMVADPSLQGLGGEDALVPDRRGLSKPWAETVIRCVAPSPTARPKDASEALALLEKRPSPWRFLVALPLLAMLALCFPPIRTRAHDRIWPPPNVRLALLPASGPDSSLPLAGGVLQDVSDRISHLKSGSRLVEVIAPTEARRIRIRTPEQAQEAHATHAFETSIRRDGTDLVVDGSLIDLKTHAQVRHFSNRYSEATLGAIPAAIAGIVSDGLHLQGNQNAEELSPAATASYDQGLQAQNSDDAMRFFEQAARLDPRSPLPLAELVEAEVRGFGETKDPNLLSQAQRHLRAAQNLNPDSVSVHFAAGKLSEATGEYEKARDQYVRASELEPQSTRALIRIANMYDKLGMPDKAIESYRAAISVNPASYKAYEHLGYFYYFRGKYSEAAEQFRKVTELAPRESLAYTNLGSSLETIGQNAEAERAYRASLKMELTADALEGIGTLLAAEHRDEEAVTYYERAAILDPRDYSTLLNLGDSNRRLRHAGLARAQYRKGMDLALVELRENPRTANARASVAYFAALLGLKDRAEDEIKQALRLAHDDNRVIFLAVKTYDFLGLRNSAVSALGEATPQLLSELSREPDLADFSRDPRFKEVVAASNKGDSK